MSSSPRIRTAVLAALAITAAAVTFTVNAGAHTVAPRAAKTWEVKMITDPGMVQRFDPKEITIQVGDTVKWIAVTGSHNVSFWPDSIPAGAADLLRKLMPDTLTATEPMYATLTGHRKPTAGDTYSIVFTGVPKGVYKYNCRPHMMRGMIAKITVQ